MREPTTPIEPVFCQNRNELNYASFGSDRGGALARLVLRVVNVKCYCPSVSAERFCWITFDVARIEARVPRIGVHIVDLAV